MLLIRKRQRQKEQVKDKFIVLSTFQEVEIAVESVKGNEDNF